jgi:hypothetical protein
LRSDLGRILRDEDQVWIDSGSIRLRLKADERALSQIIARLEGELSGWTALTSPVLPLLPAGVEAQSA